MNAYSSKTLDNRLAKVKKLYDAEILAAEDRYKLRISNLVAHYVYHVPREEFDRGGKGKL